MRALGACGLATGILFLAGSAGAGNYFPPPGDQAPTWSPDASVLVFLSDRDGQSLRVVNPDGTGERRIPWLPATFAYSFSPDWTHVAGALVENGATRMIVERLDGSDRRSLADAVYGTRASWAPEGTRLAFVVPSATPNRSDVAVARIDGSEMRRIGEGFGPVWSPVDDRIAYVAGDYEHSQLHVIRADGSGDTTLTPDSVGYLGPEWSPDGSRLAVFHRGPGASHGSLLVLRADGTPVASIPFGGITDYAWSPDGDRIAYSTGYGVFLFDVASGRRIQVAPSGWQVAWSPEGGRLAFTSGGECRDRTGIYRLSLDGSDPVRLTNDCRIVGTGGDDTLTGTALADVLVGLGGDDRLTAVSDGVGDTLEGGPGKDVLLGTFSGDTLDGGPGPDVLRGGPGPDVITGGPGPDSPPGRGRARRRLRARRRARPRLLWDEREPTRRSGSRSGLRRPPRRRLRRLRVRLPPRRRPETERGHEPPDPDLAGGPAGAEEPAPRVHPPLPACGRDAPASRRRVRTAGPDREPVRAAPARRGLRVRLRRRPVRDGLGHVRRSRRADELLAHDGLRDRTLEPARVPLPGPLARRCPSIAAVRGTILFVGAGRHQRRAILRARELGLRVVAVDRNPDAPGLAEADEAEVVDFRDVEQVAEVGRRHGVDGVLTVSADRAVPVVAAVAEELGVPGIGRATAHLMTHKVAMRRRLAEAGVPQPAFAAVRTLHEGRAGLKAVGLPAVLKPADSGGQRGVFRLDSSDDLDAHLHAALAESSTGEAIVESFHEGLELNGLAIARGGAVEVLTLSDRLRPPGIGFGVGWIHVYPTSLFGDTLAAAERGVVHAVHALGLRDGIAFPQLLASPDGVRVIEVAARIPGGQMADLARHAVGVELVEVALRQALGESVPDELARPRVEQPLAIRFLTAAPGPLPTGKVRSVGGLEKVRAFPGVVQADTYLTVGETIRPVRLDGDRRGYVIAVGETNLEALERAEAAARLVDVEVE